MEFSCASRLLVAFGMLLLSIDPCSAQPPPPQPSRLQIPREVPGADVPPIELPRADPKNPKARDEAISRLYPPLPPLGPDVVPAPGPDGCPLTLEQLQRMALENSPVIRQAEANVAAARGAAVQAGLYPNPNAGLQADQVGSANTPGLQGGFLEQTIITGGKLALARASAEVEVRNAELALRRSQIDVWTEVRSGYFAVLVAQENIKLARAMSRFTDEVYRLQVAQVRSLVAAAYEPLQLRVLALQARGNLVQARNRYLAAWKQMAAALGLPGLPPTELAGRIDAAIPLFEYDHALNRVLSLHTDVLSAENDVVRAQIDLRRAHVTPVPDVTVRGVLQQDLQSVPSTAIVSLQVGGRVPVWDRNQGGIQRAGALLYRAKQQTQRARNELSARLAEAFARYESGRTLVDYYHNRILPDQVQTFRGVYQRHQQDPNRVSFGDIIVAQQTLATLVSTYVIALGEFWGAVVDVAGLLQTDDLFHLAQPMCTDLPELEAIMHLPAGIPCAVPLPPPGLLRPDPCWPSAAPQPDDLPPPSARTAADAVPGQPPARLP